MKARFSSPFAFGLALSILPFVGGCTEDGAQSSLVGSANAQTVVDTNNNLPAPAAIAEPTAAETVPDAVVAVPEPAPATVRKLPPTIRTNSPALDVIKMAQAGVDETVMLTYITNTASMFVLTSDEIIYLNDIGVPSTVVTAMIQRDQEIKQFWSNAGQPAAQPQATTDAQAAAPTYVDPPQPEAQPAPVEPAQPTVVNNNYFNDNLSPYGTWVEIDGYGRCWQPTVVVANRGWRPYSDGGRWVYTDAGWYWLSDYSWGATTFHYGRWFNHARWGWCWWPDTVWAPSWVSYRYSNDYCGWAPLPPHAYYRTGLGFSYYGRSVGFGFDFGLSSSCYTFVSWNRFCDPRPSHHRMRPHEVTRIYNNTTIVNNYVTGDNNTVINRGIGRDRVRDLGRTEVKTVSLRDAGPSRGAGGRQERLERDGRTLVVNRPQFAEKGGRSNFDGGNSERPVSARPARSENITPAASTKEITASPDRRERPETSRTAPAVGKAAARPTAAPMAINPSPTATVTAAPKAESRPTRDSELPGNRNVRPNTSATPIANSSRPGTRPAPSAPAPAVTPAPVTQPKTESTTARPPRPQQNPVIVVGKPQGSAPTVNRAYPVYNSPQSPSRPVQPQTTTPTPVTRPQSATVNPASRTAAPTPSRPENSQITRSITSPSPSRAERPVYSTPAPSAPTYSQPTPNYSPRVSTPAPTRSYSPPPVSAPRPAPAVSAPSYTPRPASAAPAPSVTPRPAPSAPAVSAPRSSPPESRPSAPSGSQSAPAGRPGR